MTDSRTPDAAPGMPRRYAALAGVVTGLTGLAVASALSSLLRVRVNPVESVSELIRDITPGPLVKRLIDLVGDLDKPLLIGGVALGLVGLSAWAGVLARRSLVAGQLVFAAMALLAGTAAFVADGSSSASVIPVVVGFITWMVVLGLMRPAPTTAAAPPGRRAFLLRAGGFAVGAAVVAVGGRLVGQARRAVEETRARLGLSITGGSVPDGVDFELDEMTPWRVPNDEFYRIDTAFAVPTIRPEEWRLRIHGMVDNPMTLTYDDLLARELTEAWVTICCVSNQVGGDLIGNAWWSGVRIADILAEAGVRPGADAVLQTSEDGWTCGTPLEALTDDRDAILAFGMNGQPLPIEHGFPVRMIVPGLYGYVSATKWLVDLEVTRFSDFRAYWTERGWSERGPIKTQSRIELPTGGRAMAGSVPVAGQAWAQHTGIAKVEVRLDGEDWQECELARVPGDDTWVQWRTTVEAGPGIHSLAVRATDKTGYTQTPVETEVVPDGATGWHTIRFTADGE